MTPPHPPALDDDVAALLDAAIAPVPLAHDADARIKSRLLRRIAEETLPRHTTVRPDEGRWRELGGGLAMKILHRDGGVMSYLVRMAPGATLPPHRHPIDEECVVLEGQVLIGTTLVGSGGFHLGRKDVPHAAIASPDGALLFLRGAVPEPGLLI